MDILERSPAAGWRYRRTERTHLRLAVVIGIAVTIQATHTSGNAAWRTVMVKRH